MDRSIEKVGKPMSQMVDEDLPLVREAWSGSIHDMKEDIAHYRRVVQDIARFFIELPQQATYVFVVDPRAMGPQSHDRGTLLEAGILPGQPANDGMVSADDDDQSGGRYPTSYHERDLRRTAHVWSDQGPGV